MKKHGIQHCIKLIASDSVISNAVHTTNFSGGGQVYALKSATTFILNVVVDSDSSCPCFISSIWFQEFEPVVKAYGNYQS